MRLADATAAERRARESIIRSLAATSFGEGEQVLDHGLARVQGLKGQGRGWAEGFIVLTDRRLWWVGTRGAARGLMPTGVAMAVDYDKVTYRRSRRSLITMNVYLDLANGTTVRFNGGRTFLAAVVDAVRRDR